MGVMAAILSQHTGHKREGIMKQLCPSNHKEMSAYLQDFGFGGFVGYGSSVPCGLMSEVEELMRRMMYDG